MNYDNNNKITLFKNDKKGNEKAPDYRGTTTLNNQEYKVAMWVRTSAAGTKYMSGTVEIDTYKKQEEVKEEIKEADPFEEFAKEHTNELEEDYSLPF